MTSPRDTQVLALKFSSKRLRGPLFGSLQQILHGLLGFREFNAIYGRLPPCGPLDISRVFLDAMGVRIELTGEPLDKVPRTGPLVIVANHPFGMIEAMALDALLSPVRPEGGLMTLYWLDALPDYRGRLILVGQRDKRSRRKLSVRGWREALDYLRHGRCVAVFPAGRVAAFRWHRLAVADQPWSPHIASMARRTGAAVLPLYFHGRNSWRFQFAGLISPSLQNVWLVREFVNKRGRTLRATLGRLIPPEDVARFATDAEAIAFLQQETEKLARE